MKVRVKITVKIRVKFRVSIRVRIRAFGEVLMRPWGFDLRNEG